MGVLLESEQNIAVQESLHKRKETIREQLERYEAATLNGIEKLSNTYTELPDDALYITDEEYKLSGETSITNIGLGIAKDAVICKVGLSEEPASKVIDRKLSIIESLPRTDNGFPFTWYDTENGNGLLVSKKTGEPTVNVSSVDLGWFIAGLATAMAAYPQFEKRVKRLINSIDLPFLYNDRACLFWGVYDGKSKEPNGHLYDLFLSEARILIDLGMRFYGLGSDAYYAPGRSNLDQGRPKNGEGQQILSWEASALTVSSPGIIVREHEISRSGLKIIQDKFTDTMVRNRCFKSPCAGSNGSYHNHAIREFSLNPNIVDGEEDSIYGLFSALYRRPKEVTDCLSYAENNIEGAYSEKYGFVNSIVWKTKTANPVILAPDALTTILILENTLHDNIVKNTFSPEIEPAVGTLLATEKYRE